MLLAVPVAFSQALPRVEPGGVVNAASYAQPISPGSIVALFGANLASTRAAAQAAPLPTELAGTSVTVDGAKAELFFVSPTQINLKAPPLAISYASITQATFVVTTAAGSSAPVQVPVYISSPALFTADGSGCGQAAALNVSAGGAVSVNSASNSAAPGDFVALFGTGLPASIMPGLSMDGNPLSSLAYAGPAPGLDAVNQINFQIPQGTRDGCAVPVTLNSEGLAAPTVTLSIRSGRGACVDPPVESYGHITFTKTTSTGTANDGVSEIFSAVFPEAPGLKMPQQTPPPLGSYLVNAIAASPVSRSCKGNSALSAGVITVRNASGASISASPEPTPEGTAYRQTLPNGFLAPGQYAISSSGGPVAFGASVPVGAPIRIQTPLAPGTQIPSNQPLLVKWTGGAPGSVVKVSLIAIQGGGVYSRYDYGYADAVSGVFSFSPICFGHSVESGGNGVFCSFGIPSSRNAQVVVEISPAPGNITSTNAQGITGRVQVSWIYRYIFGGLSIQ